MFSHEYKTIFNPKKSAIPSFENYPSPTGKDLILLLGSSGSGKSTLANYMSGCQMEEAISESGDDILLPKLGHQEFCKVTHGVRSTTFYPQMVSLEKGIELLDCPGFDYNVGGITGAASVVLTQLAVQQAKSIHGIVVTINYIALRNADSFYKEMKSLENSVKDLYQYKDSILFFITQVPEKITNDVIILKIKKIADAEQKRIFNQQCASMLLDMLIDHPERLMLFKPLTEEQRPLLFSRLQAMKSISNEKFSMQDFESSNSYLNQYIQIVMKKFIDLFEKSESINTEKDILNLELQSIDLPHLYMIAKTVDFDLPIINNFVNLYEKYNHKRIQQEHHKDVVIDSIAPSISKPR